MTSRQTSTALPCQIKVFIQKLAINLIVLMFDSNVEYVQMHVFLVRLSKNCNSVVVRIGWSCLARRRWV